MKSVFILFSYEGVVEGVFEDSERGYKKAAMTMSKFASSHMPHGWVDTLEQEDIAWTAPLKRMNLVRYRVRGSEEGTGVSNE